MVYVGSRYQGCKFTGILGKDGKVRKYLHPRVPLTQDNVPEPFIQQDFQAGQVVDELAWRAANKPRLWWMIADVNNVLFPLEIEPGTGIMLPMVNLIEKPELG